MKGQSSVKGQISNMGQASITNRELEREVRRVFRRLLEPGSYAVPLDASFFGVFTSRNRWRKPVLRIEIVHWHLFQTHDLVCRDERGHFVPSAAGIAYARRLDAGEDSFRIQHQLRGSRMLSEAGETVQTNEAENPLGWLRHRRGPDGKALISELQFEAGERLRADYTLAQLSPRVTMDWSMALAPGGRHRQASASANVSDRALAARTRLNRALDAAGAGLSGILFEVCCSHKGLEDVERQFGWPRRSGKVVLGIALERLAEHYGIAKPGANG